MTTDTDAADTNGTAAFNAPIPIPTSTAAKPA